MRTYTKSGMTLPEELHPGTVIAAPGGGYRLISDTTIHMGTPAANPAFFVWSSPDGMDWTGLGQLPRARGQRQRRQRHQHLLGRHATTTRSTPATTAPTITCSAARRPTGPTGSPRRRSPPGSPMCGGVQLGMLYGTAAYARIQGSGIYTCAVDVNGNYQYMMNVTTTGSPWAGWAKEGTVWKLWAINAGQTYYYTSSDGINWIVSPTVWAAPVYAIYWNKERAQLEGFIDQDMNQSYYRAYRN